MDGWDHGRPRATASPAAPLRRLHEEKKSRAALTASPLDSSPLGDREAEATCDRRGGGKPSQGLRPATLPAVERRSPAAGSPAAGSPAVAPLPGRPCSLCGCAAQLPANRHRSCSSPARSPTSRLPTPGSSLLPCAVPSSSLLPSSSLAGPLSQFPKVCQAIPPKFLTLTSEIGDELVD